MSIRVVLATRNAHKMVELRRILAPYLLGVGGRIDIGGAVELVGLDAFPEIGDVAETGATFADNALLKARAVAEQSGLTAIADDSGLAVDALNGMPGVFSARWSGRHGDDVANLQLVLAQIADVPAKRRGAAFVCAAAAAAPDGRELVELGRVDGTLTHEVRGTNGFGYDPIFVPLGGAATFAELPAADKDALSHRARAFEALAPRLAALIP
jgi:XTP/dITP diphosphohydrolase